MPGQVQCLPTWLAGIQQSPITSEPEFPRYDKCSLTLMPPEGPKRDNSPTAWPSKEQTLTKALTGDAIVPLSNS